MKRIVIITTFLISVTFSMPIYVSADIPTTSSAPATTSTSNDSNVSSSIHPMPPLSLSLSLEDALKRAEKNYDPVVLDDKHIEILERQYEQALGYQQLYRENGIDFDKQNEVEMLELNVPVALYNLNDGKHKREIDFKNAKVTITNEYENILAAQMQKEYINEAISNLQKDMDSINEKIKVGIAKTSDISRDKVAMAKYQAALSSAENGIQSLMISLKNDLGIDPITEVTPTSNIMDYKKFDNTDISGKIETSIKNSFSIKTLPEQIENAKLSYEIYKSFSAKQEDSTQISIKDLQNELEQKPKTIAVQLKIKYNTLKSAEATVEADKISIEAAQISLNTVLANYSMGQVIYLDVLNAKLQLSNSKNTLQQDMISYMMASMNFQNSLEEQ